MSEHSKFVATAILSSTMTLGGVAAVHKQDTPPPKCEINEQALDAIKEQNKQLFDSNKDLRTAIESLPKDAKDYVSERVKVEERLKILDERIQQATTAEKSYQTLEKELKNKPCNDKVSVAPTTDTVLTTANVVYATPGIGFAPMNTQLGGFSINLGQEDKRTTRETPLPSAITLFIPAAVAILWKFRA